MLRLPPWPEIWVRHCCGLPIAWILLATDPCPGVGTLYGGADVVETLKDEPNGLCSIAKCILEALTQTLQYRKRFDLVGGSSLPFPHLSFCLCADSPASVVQPSVPCPWLPEVAVKTCRSFCTFPARIPTTHTRQPFPVAASEFTSSGPLCRSPALQHKKRRLVSELTWKQDNGEGWAGYSIVLWLSNKGSFVIKAKDKRKCVCLIYRKNNSIFWHSTWREARSESPATPELNLDSVLLEW